MTIFHLNYVISKILYSNIFALNITTIKVKQLISNYFNKANLTQVDFTKVILDISWDEISFKEAYFENTIMPDGTVRNS